MSFCICHIFIVSFAFSFSFLCVSIVFLGVTLGASDFYNVFLGVSFDTNDVCLTGNSPRPSTCSLHESVQLEEVAIHEHKASVNGDQGNPVCATANSVVSDVM
jgi:hypothetical protein